MVGSPAAAAAAVAAAAVVGSPAAVGNVMPKCSFIVASLHSYNNSYFVSAVSYTHLTLPTSDLV